MAGHLANDQRPNEGSLPDPLAYFLTWTTYGTWLPGDERGWVWRGHGIQLPDFKVLSRAANAMTEPPCYLDSEQRELVEVTISKQCGIRGWELSAVNCRTNHAHVVVAADVDPRRIRDQFKAWCSRRLNELQSERRLAPAQMEESAPDIREKWWTERGSIRCLGDEISLEAAVVHVRDLQ